MKPTANDWKIAFDKEAKKRKTKRSGRGYKRSSIEQGDRMYSLNGGICCSVMANNILVGF